MVKNLSRPSRLDFLIIISINFYGCDCDKRRQLKISRNLFKTIKTGNNLFFLRQRDKILWRPTWKPFYLDAYRTVVVVYGCGIGTTGFTGLLAISGVLRVVHIATDMQPMYLFERKIVLPAQRIFFFYWNFFTFHCLHALSSCYIILQNKFEKYRYFNIWPWLSLKIISPSTTPRALQFFVNALASPKHAN